MRTTMTLSEFIEQLQNSLLKTPQVKNYQKIKNLLPQLESMLENKGDVTFPIKSLLAIIS